MSRSRPAEDQWPVTAPRVAGAIAAERTRLAGIARARRADADRYRTDATKPGESAATLRRRAREFDNYADRFAATAADPWPHPDDLVDAARALLDAAGPREDELALELGEGGYYAAVHGGALNTEDRTLADLPAGAYKNIQLDDDELLLRGAGGTLSRTYVAPRQVAPTAEQAQMYAALRAQGEELAAAARITGLVV